MKTEIYQTYADFCKREDKTLNGVSPEFAEQNPGWDTERNNQGCWNCSRCFACWNCSGCSGCSHCCDCSRCFDCSRCDGCSRCFDCCDCSRCSHCSHCCDMAPQKTETAVPVVGNIHRRVLDAVNATPDALDMAHWHTCETTHCRAGWVVTLAGEAGKALEAHTSTAFAAMQIYKASSPIRVSPTRFYEDNETAMADIRRCAAEEAALSATK